MSANTLRRLFRDAVERHGDRVAIATPKRTLTYAELAAATGRLMSALTAAGVVQGDRVGLALPKSAEALAAVFAILELGACYVPIDAFGPGPRAAAILDGCRCRCVVSTAAWVKKVAPDVDLLEVAVIATEPTDEIRAMCPRVRWVTWSDAPDAPLDAAAVVADTDLAYVLHTSGTTGRPKGVALSHANARFFVDMATEFFSISGDDRLVAQAPLHFDLSVFDLYCAVAAGAAVVMIPEFYSAFPKKMSEAIDAHGITVWNSVVSTLLLMSDRGQLEARSCESLRLVIFSGEPMPLAKLARLREQLPRASFYNVYGQTEANSSLYYPVSRLPAGATELPIGKPFPGFDVFAIGGDGSALTGPGPVGELHVRAGTVGTGYWEDSARTAAKFVADPRHSDDGAIVYRTGDRVHIDESGDFLFVGRTDNMVKTRGYRVELGEVEEVLSRCDGVERAVVVAVPDDSIGNQLVAFVTPILGSELSREAVAAHCSSALPRYMVPAAFHFDPDLPLTTTGKLDRRELARRARSLASD